jgi:hypothetical protein
VASDIDSTAVTLPCAIPVDAFNVGTSTTGQQLRSADDAFNVGTSTVRHVTANHASVRYMIQSKKDSIFLEMIENTWIMNKIENLIKFYQISRTSGFKPKKRTAPRRKYLP